MKRGWTWVWAAQCKLRAFAASGIAVAILLSAVFSAASQTIGSADPAPDVSSSADGWPSSMPKFELKADVDAGSQSPSDPPSSALPLEMGSPETGAPGAHGAAGTGATAGPDAVRSNQEFFSGPLFETGWLRNVDATLIGIASAVALCVLSGLIVVAGAGRKFSLQRPAQKSRFAIADDQNDRQACLGLVEQAAALWRSAESAVLRLDESAPIRRLLLNELRQVEKLLSRDVNTQTTNRGALTSRMSGDYWRILRQRLRRTIRDLERILATADAAIETLGDQSHEPRMPKSREEALLVLGASKGADVEVLNRLVRALRQCWHPDLAQTDADRIYRDARLAQINVAYDLLTGRRLEG